MSDHNAPFSGDPDGRMTPSATRIRDLAADLDDAGDHQAAAAVRRAANQLDAVQAARGARSPSGHGGAGSARRGGADTQEAPP